MRIVSLMIVLVVLPVLAVAFYLAENKPSPEEVMDVPRKKYSTPDAGQDALKALVGVLDVESAMQVNPPAGVMTSGEKMVNVMILDGRFLMEGFDGEFVGQPFRGGLVDSGSTALIGGSDAGFGIAAMIDAAAVHPRIVAAIPEPPWLSLIVIPMLMLGHKRYGVQPP